MNILVTFASRHGSTRAIAETIAAELETLGHRTVFRDISHVTSLEGYDAIVLGSGVYHGHWLAPAREFLDRYQPELSMLPTWLFSSGLVGEQPVSEPPDVTARRDTIRLMAHRSFAGRLDAGTLGISERIMSRLAGSAEGDFRNWCEIRAWAQQIGDELLPAHSAARTATS